MKKIVAYVETKKGVRINLPDTFMPETRKTNPYYPDHAERIGVHWAFTNPHIISQAAEACGCAASSLRIVCVEQIELPFKPGWAICSATEDKPMAESLSGFATEEKAQNKLRNLTERGVIAGIPVIIRKF